MDKTNIANLPRDQRVTETVTIGIAGMTCDECVPKSRTRAAVVAGIKELTVDRANALARVTFDDWSANVPAMHDALLRSGYRPVPTPVG